MRLKASSLLIGSRLPKKSWHSAKTNVSACSAHLICRSSTAYGITSKADSVTGSSRGEYPGRHTSGREKLFRFPLRGITIAPLLKEAERGQSGFSALCFEKGN